MEIDKIKYKNFDITVSYSKDDKSFHAYSLCGNSNAEFNPKLGNFTCGHETPDKAIENVKSKIDEFLKIAPKTYDELAEQLSSNLTWTGYESCHLESSIVKILVESFNKVNSKK